MMQPPKTEIAEKYKGNFGNLHHKPLIILRVEGTCSQTKDASDIHKDCFQAAIVSLAGEMLADVMHAILHVVSLQGSTCSPRQLTGKVDLRSLSLSLSAAQIDSA